MGKTPRQIGPGFLKTSFMKYIIISLSHGTGKEPCFWKAEAAGYTNSPFAAGIYTEEEVKARPNYYNNGCSCVAIPLTEQAMEAIGFKCSFNEKAIEQFFQVA
jgi:hypothetical protein